VHGLTGETDSQAPIFQGLTRYLAHLFDIDIDAVAADRLVVLDRIVGVTGLVRLRMMVWRSF
jgi:hypothetical protein